MEAKTQSLKIGAVLFPDFELLDIYGPIELFGMLGERVSITMLAERAGEIKSNQGPKGVADECLTDVSELDVLLVPGGWGTRAGVQNTYFLELLKAVSANSRFVASICTGSALLAKAGILDGKKATSNKMAFDWVATQGPKVNWIREARWVEDGKYITSSGVSAGMDMALGMIQQIFDRDTALQAARYAEYIWHEDRSVDPFASQALKARENG